VGGLYQTPHPQVFIWSHEVYQKLYTDVPGFIELTALNVLKVHSPRSAPKTLYTPMHNLPMMSLFLEYITVSELVSEEQVMW